MRIVLTCVLEREEGLFASKEEVAEALIDMLDDVDGVGANGDSTYTLLEVDWE